MPAQSSDAPTPRKQTPPQTPILGKPVIKEFSTPDLRDRVIVVRQDLRKETFEIPTQGSSFEGVDRKDIVRGYVFATAQPSDPPGVYLDLYYVKTRDDQDRYNMEITFPYVDKNFPRLTRTYIVPRTDKLATDEPQADTVDPVLTNLKLTDHKIERLTDSAVLDAIFVKVIRVFEKLPGPIITSFDTNQFQQRVTVKTQEVEKSDPTKLSALVEKSSQERVGTAKAKNTAASVPRVFPNETFETEMPDLPHEEFLAGFISKTTTQRLAGQASQPDLDAGEFGLQEQQETEFVKRNQRRFQDLPQERVHRETFEQFGGGLLDEVIRIDTPLASMEVEEGFTVVDSKVRDLGPFGKVRQTKELFVQEPTHVELTNAGGGFPSPPAITLVDSAGNPYAQGAVVTPDMARGVGSVVVTNGGGQYDFAPAVIFRGDCQRPAAGVALMSRGVDSIVLTNPGSGYSQNLAGAIAVNFSGGQGSGASATVTLGFPIRLADIVLTGANQGTGYSENVVVQISGDGTGAQIVVKKKHVVGGKVTRLTILEPGHGFTTAPTLTILDMGVNNDGSGAGINANGGTAPLATNKGQIKTVNLVTGGEYLSPPTITITGGSPTKRATATAVMIAGSTRVKGVTILDPGLGYTAPPIVEFHGGSINPNIAQATGYSVLESTYHLMALRLTTPGTWEPGDIAPKVVFTPNPGNLAKADFIVGGWPVLYSSVVDPKYGLVTQLIKRVVPAGQTWEPGDGYTEFHAHDKWRTIMVTSRADLRSLPPPLTYPTTRNIALPTHLEDVYPDWDQTVGSSSVTTQVQAPLVGEPSFTLRANASMTGSIVVRASRGYAGPALAMVTEMFFGTPPTVDSFPKIKLIQGVYGTATMFGQSKSAFIQTGATTNGSGSTTTTRVSTEVIGPVLTGRLYKSILAATDSSVSGGGYGSPDNLIPYRGFDGTLIYPQGMLYQPATTLDVQVNARMQLDIPDSTPEEIESGFTYPEALIVERLGLGIWKVTLINVYVP